MSQLKTLCVFGTRPEAIKMAPFVLHCLAGRIGDILGLATIIAQLTKQFEAKQHALFLGRDPHYPIAMAGILTLKEISYVYVESCAAGELKHGPLPLVGDDMPLVSVAPIGSLLEKLKSNLREVRVRGGQLSTSPANAPHSMTAKASPISPCPGCTELFLRFCIPSHCNYSATMSP